MAVYVSGGLLGGVDATALDGVPANLTPLTGKDGYVVTLDNGDLVLAPDGSVPRSGALVDRGSAVTYAGGLYLVTSGVGDGDLYESDGASWRLVSFDTIGGFAPTLWWKLDEVSGTTAANSGSATGGDWTIVGSPTLHVPTAYQSSGISFNAASKFASGYGVTPSSTTAFSTCATCKFLTSTGSFQPLIVRRLATPGEPYSWYLGILNNTVVMYFRDAAQGSFSTLTGSGYNVSIGVEHHIAASLAGGTLTLYLDGLPVGSVGVPGGILWATTGSPTWETGYSGTGSEVTSGLVANVQIYDGTGLSAAQVAELAQRALGNYGGQ